MAGGCLSRADRAARRGSTISIKPCSALLGDVDQALKQALNTAHQVLRLVEALETATDSIQSAQKPARGHWPHEHLAPQEKRSGLITFGELCNYELKESPVEGCGVKPDQCSRSKRSSLALLAASRAFSFLSYSIAFLSCKIICSSAYRCTFLSIVGCQLSFCKSRRHRGKTQGIPACCGRSTEAAPRIETCGESAETAVQQRA
jgi:hypothetical protein